MNDSFDKAEARNIVERNENWREWCDKIPALNFKKEWNVKVIPPFGGAMARFLVSYNNRQVSVYLDVFSRLGYMYNEVDEIVPYYEIYPHEGDAKRYYLTETDEMMKDIDDVLMGRA